MTGSRLVLLCSVAALVLGSSALVAAPPQKLRVKSVIIDGNEAFSDRRLKRVMLTRPSGLFSRRYYFPEVFEDDLKNLVLFYQQNGYLEAAVDSSQVDVDSTNRYVDIRILVREGELTLVEGVGVFGSTVFSDSLLFDRIGMRSGNPFKRKKVQDAALSILTLYANNGYLDAEVNPDIRIDTENHRALMDFIIRERSQSHIGRIRIEGLQKTAPKIVERELLFHPGEVAKYGNLLESQRRLYLTGLFQNIFIRPVPTVDQDSTKKDILIEVKENESIEFNIYFGYGSVDRGRTKIEIFNNNLAGRARKVGFSAKASFISYGAEASFTEPRTFGLRWRTDVNLLYEYLEEPGFDVERIGGRVVFGRTFGKRSTLSLAYRIENSDLLKVKVRYIPAELETNLRSLKLSLIYDTRDNLFNTRSGVYLEWSNELAGSFLRGTDDFWRSLWRIKYFCTWKIATVFAAALDVGWMDYFGRSTEIPLSERFYTGGPNSLRGFDYRSAGPLDENGKPLGGNFKVVLNLIEVRQTIYKMFGGVFFVDIGNVWKHADNFHFEDLRSCVGFGLRANTPIGIVRCDYGINVEPEKDEPRGKLYFNVGQAF